MSILTRFAVVLIVAGLLIGLVLRVVVKRRRLRSLMLLGLVPWLLHALLVGIRTVRDGAPAAGAVVFGVTGLALALAAALIAWRAAERRPILTALMPLLLAVVYGALPFALYLGWLRRYGVGVDTLITVAYVWASLFASSALVVLAPRAPAAPGRWLRRRR